MKKLKKSRGGMDSMRKQRPPASQILLALRYHPVTNESGGAAGEQERPRRNVHCKGKAAR